MKTKHSLFTSIVALVLCVAMLAGTTFAWFTDAVSSKSNIIQSGNLDITMEWANDFNATTWNDATMGAIFTHDNWEPGYTDVKYIKITNAGNLNLKWRLTLEAEGTVTKLSDVIGVYCVNPATGNLTSIDGLTPAGMLTNVLNNKDVFAPTGALARGEEVIVAIAMHMDEEAGNTYQGLSLCNAGFSVKLVATQNVGEHDSFGDDYDNDAEWPEFKMDFEEIKSLAGISTTYDALATDVTIRHKSGAYAIVPAGTKLAAGATELKFTGKNVESNGNFADTAKSYDIHIEGIAADNDQCITVFLGKILEPGLGATALKLYHESTQMTRVNSVSDFASPDQYTYDAETGAVTIYVKNFSVFSAVQTSADVWDGTSDTSWYNTTDTEFTLTTAEQLAGFRDIVDGKADGIEYDSFANKTVKLGADIDLNNKLFNPIGGGWAYNGGNTFNGTFDGGNHTIYNLYVNGWELDGSDKHSGTSMGAGLFSSIHNATIKNLAICGAELVVETTSIGVVVGCAQGKCTFENIIVSDAVLGNYQMRNGGIVGDIYVIESDGVTEGEYSHTFTNIVVDSTVKLCSMWGDFDTGNGGVIGGKYGSAKVLMQNVVVAAELDVFSDVTAAYQWYAYRRCGMLVGYTGENSPKQATNASANFLTCENVTVYYGDWVNYTYYQFANQTDEAGNRLWYSNYPWVRAEESVYNGPFSNVRYGNPVINGEKINTLELAEAKKTAKTDITFNQLYGGGQGVYGTNEHDGVTIHNDLANAKTIYIHNNLGWKNLKLQYWFKNGDDTWTTNIDGIAMEALNTAVEGIYRVTLPVYADGFRIVADGENTSAEFILKDLYEGNTYDLNGNALNVASVNGAFYQTLAEAIANANGGTVTLVSDVVLRETLTIDGAKVTLDLNGKTISAANDAKIVEVLLVKNNANVIITGHGTMLATGEGEGVEHVEVISAIDDATVTIKNGTFVSDGCTAIYATRGATVNIYGGYFEAKEKYDGRYFTIDVNEDEEVTGIIKVYGGTYVSFDPANHTTDGANYKNKLANDCLKSTYDENNNLYTVSADHTFVDNKCECGAIQITKWKLVTNATNLVANDQIIIVSKDVSHAISTNQKDSNRDAAAIVKNGDGTITINENVQILTLVAGTTDGTFGFYTGSGYLYAASSSSNQLKTQINNNVNGDWTITITDGVASIVAKGSTNRNVMQYNPNNGSPLFSCYSSASQTAVAIYKLTGDGVIEAHECTNYAIGATCEKNATCAMCAQEIADSKLDHTRENIVITEANCTNEGYTTYTCSMCKNKYVTDRTDALGHTTDSGTCERCHQPIGGSVSEKDTVTVVIADYADANSWADATKYASIILNDFVTATVTGDSNTGKYYVNGENWRMYQTENAKLTIAANGKTIVSVKISYESDKTGSLTLNGKNIASGTIVTINTNSIVFDIGNTGTATNGQVRITEIEVVYGSEGDETTCQHTNTTTTTVDATCTTAGSTTVTCDDCGETVSTETIDALGHNYVEGVCSVCGEEKENAGGNTESTTATMNIYANKGTLSNKVITWTSGNVTFSNAQANSTSAIRTSDSDHFRVYANSEVTIAVTSGTITEVVITCTSSSYANAMKTSAENAGYTATVSGSVVTITVGNAEEITFTASAQTRLNKVEVTYIE